MSQLKKKDALANNVSNAESHLKKPTSPIELPEILTKIMSQLTRPTLARTCQVSRLFHTIAIPLLWNTIVFDAESASTIWQQDKGFRLGLIRYGRFVENIHLQWATIQDGDMELIAENCVRLKSLDLTSSNITVETLRVLIHSDPYNVMPGDSKKRKRRQQAGQRRQQAGEDGDDESNDDDDDSDSDNGDVNAKMTKYRSMTETETEHEADYYHNYESVGLEPSTATESEQEQQGQLQPTGPVLPISREETSTSAIEARPRISSVVIPPHRRAGTTRPAKFKGTKTQFPYHLERLVLNRCKELTGKSCLAAVSLLGPQLKSLSLNHISDLEDTDLLDMTKHCPNLSAITLKGTEVTDEFLKVIAGVSANHNDVQERKLRLLNVDMTSTSYKGLVPLISSSLDKMTSFSCQNIESPDETLYAFIEDANTVKQRYSGGDEQRKKAILALSSTNRLFKRNTVLTEIDVSYCARFTDAGFRSLFQYATELMSVNISGCQVTDESLLILAKSNRTRMMDLGYGVPTAWHEHEVAMERLLAAKKGKKKQMATSPPPSPTPSSGTQKVFTGGFRGGLQRLFLTNCSKLTNKGLRAIVRSCVNLDELYFSNCTEVSMEVFNGPWACTDIKILEMSDIYMPRTLLTKSERIEEDQELKRFPPTSEDDYDESLDFEMNGSYDYIVKPPVEFDIFGSDDDEDSDQDDQDDQDDGSDVDVTSDGGSNVSGEYVSDDEELEEFPRPKFIFPKTGRNTPQQRHILREFYSKLGQFSQLVRLNMAYGDYRIRVKDGLDLTLPGLQQHLMFWDITRPPSDFIGEEELVWFSKNFGYGYEFTKDEEERRKQRERIKESRQSPQGLGANRVSKLREIKLNTKALEEVDEDVYEWFLDQGIDIEDSDDFDSIWNDYDD
ncbi:hypothetical protein BGZ46_009682 [Entomortierella lignicola]|nr:hypothetical protein BGZ46_009682 [Entomortierella lignicola]